LFELASYLWTFKNEMELTNIEQLTFDSWSTVLLNLTITSGITFLLSNFLWKKNKISQSSKDTSIFLAITVCAVITVIKSSLTLSLGLVGALSIVRFRTAIKNQEDLVFLFVAIVIGLSVGANQYLSAIFLMIFYLFIGNISQYNSRNKLMDSDILIRILLKNNKNQTIHEKLEDLPDLGFRLVSMNKNVSGVEVVLKLVITSDYLSKLETLENLFLPDEIYVHHGE
jgi:hypothetical protein